MEEHSMTLDTTQIEHQITPHWDVTKRRWRRFFRCMYYISHSSIRFLGETCTKMLPHSEREPLLSRRAYENGLVSKLGTTSSKVSKTTLIWILLGLWSAIFLGALDGTIVATLVTPIGSYFQQSHKSSYLGTSYLLSVCCFTPLYGRLSDILGRKGAMLLSLGLFTGGTLFCGIAPSMDFLLLARAIAGMVRENKHAQNLFVHSLLFIFQGGGGMMTVSNIIMTDLIPLKQRGLYHGMANVLFGVGGGLGGPIGGWINDTIGCSRLVTFYQIPLLLACILLLAFKLNIQLPSGNGAQTPYDILRRIDWLGSLTLVCAVGTLLLGVSLKTSEDIPWSNPLVWGLLLMSAIFTAFFVLVEARWSHAPVMPVRFLMKRTPLAVALANLFSGVTGFAMLYNVPLYFSAVRLTTFSQAGAHLLPNSIAIAAGSVLAGWVMHRTGKFYTLTMISAPFTIISCILVAAWDEDSHIFHLWFDIVPSGFGTAIIYSTTLIALIASIPRGEIAVATGISFLFRTSGQVLGVSLTGALVQGVLMRQLRKRIIGPGSEELIQRIKHDTDFIATLLPPLRTAATESYSVALRAVFICQAGVALCTLFSCIFIEENSLPDSHEEQEQDEQNRRCREENQPPTCL
ncbi:vacuolar amino acid permease [Ramaria rubella]|nr:vacuolar amino acid permease [Ramaria rubella]